MFYMENRFSYLNDIRRSSTVAEELMIELSRQK